MSREQRSRPRLPADSADAGALKVTLVVFALALLTTATAAVAQTMPADAVVIRKPEYELYYMPQYREDGERAARLLDQTVALGKSKYGTTYRGVPCTVNLYPTPNGIASTGSAMITSSVSGDGVSLCTVHLLTWSAPEWRTAGRSLWGDPKDIEYWNALLVNEYITIFHTLTSVVGRPSGFRESSAPSWWREGLEAYDGYYHSTAASLERVRGLMGDGRLGVFLNGTTVYCCESSLGGQALLAKQMYVDGLALVSFLAHRYGESIHARLIRSQQGTFEEALVQETGHTFDGIFSAYSQWLNSWEPLTDGVIAIGDHGSATAAVLDFGTVPAGTRVTKQLTVRNTGSAPLTVDRVQTANGTTPTSLSCSVNMPYPTNVAPGSFGLITYNCTIPAGMVTGTSIITSNASNSSVTIQLTGTGQ